MAEDITTGTRLPINAKVCNCARCGCLLMSIAEKIRWATIMIELPKQLAGRANGRPYCETCLDWLPSNAKVNRNGK